MQGKTERAAASHSSLEVCYAATSGLHNQAQHINPFGCGAAYIVIEGYTSVQHKISIQPSATETTRYERVQCAANQSVTYQYAAG